VVKNSQLWEYGLSRWTVARWVRAGRLHPIYPGVYAVGHTSLSLKGELIAALFHAGEGAALAHESAAFWWQLVDKPPPRIHIAVPGRRRCDARIVVHRPKDLERTFHRGVPVTPVPRTLLDLAAGASRDEVRKALAEADYRNLLEPPALLSMLRRGQPGSASLRAALDTHLPQLAETLSPLEDGFLLLCERHGFPMPEPNQWIGSYKVDALWRAERIIVELDGRDAHSSPAQRMRDHERDMKLRAAGYIVRRYSWHQVHLKPAEVAADLRAAFAERAASAT